jgi:hypothetical protein
MSDSPRPSIERLTGPELASLLETTRTPVVVLGLPGSGYSTVMERANELVQRVEVMPSGVSPGTEVVLMHCLSASVYSDALDVLTGGAVTARALATLPVSEGILVRRATT